MFILIIEKYSHFLTLINIIPRLAWFFVTKTRTLTRMQFPHTIPLPITCPDRLNVKLNTEIDKT